jgi:hypothetical protein
MLNETTLKADLRSDILALFEKCDRDEGMSGADYANEIAEVIAKRIVAHLKAYAAVSPGAEWVAGGQYPVTGGATGKVS